MEEEELSEEEAAAKRRLIETCREIVEIGGED